MLDETDEECERRIRTVGLTPYREIRRMRVCLGFAGEHATILPPEEVHELKQVTRPIPGFDWHSLDKAGNVYVLWFGRPCRAGRSCPHKLQQHENLTTGYKRVGISRKTGGKPENWLVHRLMAITWLDAPSPDEILVRHLDGVGSNNCIENLAWGTEQDNANDRIWHSIFGKGNKNSVRPDNWLEHPKVQQYFSKRVCKS